MISQRATDQEPQLTIKTQQTLTKKNNFKPKAFPSDPWRSQCKPNKASKTRSETPKPNHNLQNHQHRRNIISNRSKCQYSIAIQHSKRAHCEDQDYRKNIIGPNRKKISPFQKKTLDFAFFEVVSAARPQGLRFSFKMGKQKAPQNGQTRQPKRERNEMK